MWSLAGAFKDELQSHSGKVNYYYGMQAPVHNEKQVTDSLGMNGYKVIEFDDDEKFFLFIMKWG